MVEKYSKEEQELKEIAEKLMMQEFDNLNEEHEFSASYQSKKQQFLNAITKEDTQKVTRMNKKKWFMLIAASALLIPTTIFGAAEVYRWLVQKDNYELNFSLKDKPVASKDKYYQLELGYLPKEMEKDKNSGKYSYKETPSQGGLSFLLWQVTDKADFKELFTKDYQETTFGKHQGLVIEQVSLSENDPTAFDTKAYLLFEEEGYMLETYIGNDVPESEWRKVLESASLKETTEDKAMHYQKTSDYVEEKRVAKHSKEKYLPIDSTQIHSIGDKVEVEIPQTEYQLSLEVTQVEVMTDISSLDVTNFGSYPYESMEEEGLIEPDGKLKSFKQKKIKPGDGKSTVDEVIEEADRKVNFVYLTATIENLKETEVDDLYFQNAPMLLEETEHGYLHLEENVDQTSYSGEVDYLDSHGEGDSYYRMPKIEGKEKRVIHFGYFVDDDQLDKLFLPVLSYDNFDDISSKNIQWIDIRQ